VPVSEALALLKSPLDVAALMQAVSES